MPNNMGEEDVAFPHLGIYLENLGKTFSIFGFEIAYYGVIIGLGVMLAFIYCAHIAKKEDISQDTIYDLGIFLVLFGIIGARLYFVIFSWDYYKGKGFLKLINIREGGLAIYGGVLAGLVTLIVFCKIKKLNVFKLGDIAVSGVLIGQILGRYGNFFNREVFGTYSDGLLAMRLPVRAVRQSDMDDAIRTHIVPGTNYIQVHPTFLYESLYNLVLFLLIMVFRKKKKFNGEVMLWYFGGYGIGRAVIEGIRTDRLLIGNTNIAVSQVLGFVLFVVSVVLDLIFRVRLMSNDKNEEAFAGTVADKEDK